MKLQQSNLEKVLQTLSKQAKVLVPVVEEGVGKYIPWQPGAACDLAMVNTVLPPKDALFPQTEKMFTYRWGDEFRVEEVVDLEAQIIFGMRPCDVASIDCMDLVFLTKTFVDNFYARKRDNLTMVAVTCTDSDETCFCSSMGQDPGAAPSADVVLHPTKSGWNVTVQTEKGQALADALSGLLEDGEDTPLPAAEPVLRPDMDGVPERLREMFDDPMWDDVYRPCLTCGTCTFLCPTCYCFEIGADDRGSHGVQERFWDSCMFSEYTRMAGGHNPRPSNKERVRNRYMHKLTWFEERYGRSLCVGCGRCISQCPVGMDITDVIDRVKEVEPSATNASNG